MGFIRKLLGVAPTPTDDGAFKPSPLALKLATSATTDYDGGSYAAPYSGDAKRVLVICTEERNMTMANGNKFSTGNHPVEMGLPMLHLIAAGFEIDIVTPTGAPAAIEEWAMPRDDANVMKLFRDYADALANPGSLSEFVANSMTDDAPYVAVFLPGGHGAMLGLPENADLGKLLRWANGRDLFTLAICHGPAALLAADDRNPFLFNGYKIAAFPDAVDKQTPAIGYMPGHMPWKFGEKLNALGVTIVNTKADNSCHVDRRLITGASPKAANNFGRLAAETLLKSLT
ncbi:protein deglycase HchA [Aliiroseovarius sp. KMU-50]|uniref:Protein deglycase HchA n=1 Tax=Aliiroseovarius salicola TaxID=3009082 RepID=A0ABT4VZR7_9RHOB|nr:glyoxalase III HchA [Aliiroseovarius sp. KMU-50]MDA5093743.1 protein deglycase HchA [Aliiroseovarius sp. KMU-50]